MLDPTARVLRLLSLLQTHRFWPGGELATELEVSRRTLRRDIERLRRLGYPVDATPGVSGGYRLAAGSHMPPLLLDDDEAIAIAVGLRASTSAAVAGIEDTSVRALAKIEQILPDRLRRRVNAVHSNVAVLQRPATTAGIDPGDLAVLAIACRDHEEVRFDYRRRDGEEARRLVRPHQLVSVGRRWYLVGWDVRRDDWRTFRVDRLRDLRLGGTRFTPQPLPAEDAAAFVAEALRAAPMPHTATLTVAAGTDVVTAEMGWIAGAVEAIDDTRCRIILRADTPDWLVSTIATVAGRFDVDIDAGPDIAALLSTLADRLAAGGPGNGDTLTVTTDR